MYIANVRFFELHNTIFMKKQFFVEGKTLVYQVFWKMASRPTTRP